ncbi:TetR family transcriptional regulator [Tardiphaga sp. vice352]|uniref:TetR/AcrR family transcriptional regulator n=3 Tax=Tardiphaga TaxID=1395974 RepID=UPI001163C6C3|nr:MULTISPECIES: TetR/AcrR family transcriptional regulator [unclassified Tardiphaga]QDM18791.1 TetR family transcriptional regulator [Tardiphaga sp. vice278]QDM23785.1 TetR family transcriptional regulator [Tardiphaga sp. vice154]QDM29008.1 TetR family transcriptional regulator [Tardiphaga sp. vice304]QDM34107.1 TetR family transcriptional regulator [Tardiphaga sp. vice352]
MTKLSNRERMLAAGLEVVHAHGYAGASVRDIVSAAGVPQGSFTNHFACKEEFVLEILDLYVAAGRELMAATLLNEKLSPLQRLSDYLDANQSRLDANQMRNGCLFGNFSAEATDHSEPIRARLVEIFAELQRHLAICLRAAVEAGELPEDFATDEVAGFIVSSLQGACLLAKAERSPAPFTRFKQVLFSQVLR